jgi:hypothetical protein
MKRMIALALVGFLGSASGAFAEGALLSSATRHAVEMGRTEARKPVAAAQAGQTGPTLESSGMRKRTKILIAIAAGVGFGATVYAIDHNVLDVTPSTLGTRQD